MHTSMSPTLSEPWRLQDAKAQFSALVELAIRGTPQHINRRGKEAVVVLSAAEYASLQAKTQALPKSFVTHLFSIPAHPDSDFEFERMEIEPRSIDLS
jgi:antitoxin Phd